jgi:Uma2 family endonuclease
MQTETPAYDPTPPPAFAFKARRVHLTDEQFEQLCYDNPDYCIEMTAEGEIRFMPPTGTESSWRNSSLNRLVGNWSEADGTGLVFDSQVMFTLPSGAKRMPDVAWLPRERYYNLPLKERQGFARLVPDFVIELRSPTDNLSDLQAKMAEYSENGVRLGWLIDPQTKRVHIYRPHQAPEILDDPESVSGEDVLPGLAVNVRSVW